MHSPKYAIYFHKMPFGRRFIQVPAGSQFLHLFDHCNGSIRAVIVQPTLTCQCVVHLEIPLEPPRDVYHVPAICTQWQARTFNLNMGHNALCVPDNWVVSDFREGRVTLRGPRGPSSVMRHFYVIGCNASVTADLADRLNYVGAAVTYSLAKQEWSGRIELFELADSKQASSCCGPGRCSRVCACAATDSPTCCGVPPVARTTRCSHGETPAVVHPCQ